MAKLTKRKEKSEKLPLRERISLSTVLMLTAAVGIIVASLTVGSYSLNVLYENKLRDTWAIMFLEMEQRAGVLSKNLKRHEYANNAGEITKSTKFAKPEVVAEVDNSSLKLIVGSLPDGTSLKSFGLRAPSLQTNWNILQYSGFDYLAKFTDSSEASILSSKKLPKGKYLILWKTDFSKWMTLARKALDGTKVYAITREGRLLFTNSPEVNEQSFLYRTLVQRFVKDPLAAGQLEFQDVNDETTYGFFQEIPSSNVVFFAETPKAIALGAIKTIILRSIYVLVGVLALAILLLQLPISRSIGPIRELVELTREIASGNFKAKPKHKGFGEIALLTESFELMGKGLIKRDDAITELMEEQKEKVRLEGELKVAQTIQNNLLPAEKLPKESGLDVESYYKPAEECAGDWYGYYYDEEKNETIIAIADVSGHGTGSSMFTAIIASNFQQIVNSREKDLDKFFHLSHESIDRLGKGNWHATMQVAKYRPNEDEMDFINAGHSFPCIHDSDSELSRGKFVSMPSNILGIVDEVLLGKKTIKVKSGTKILMSTDGILEAKNSEEQDYGKRRLARLCARQSTSSKQEISNLVNDMDEYCGDVKKDDDICIIATRVA